jgi:hypothetical protein
MWQVHLEKVSMNDVYSQIVSQIARLAGWLAGLFVYASQRGIKVLLGLCVYTVGGTYQIWTEG